MKLQSAKDKFELSCDDFPMPLVIHRKLDGMVVKCNKAAKMLLVLHGKKFKLKKVRRVSLSDKRTHYSSNGFNSFDAVYHQKQSGQDINLTLFRKSLVWLNQNCWADFLQQATDKVPTKSKIIQSSLDAFVSINEAQKICDWNPAAEKIFGWKKEEAIGSKLADLIIPEELKKQHEEGFNRYLKTGKHKILNRLVEITAQNKKGERFSVELTITPVREEGRKMFYGFIRDISERKKVEHELRENEEKLKRAQSVASIGSWEMYGNFRELHWSDEFYRIYGLEPGSVKPSTKLRLAMTHPQDREKLQQAIDEATHQGKPYNIEHRIIKPNGEICWVHSQGETTVDTVTGKRKVFGTILDITERKRAEEELTQLNASLSETLIFGKMGSAELNLKTLQISVSKELLYLLDQSVQEAQSMSLQTFLSSYVHPNYLPLIYQKISEGSSGPVDLKKVVDAEFQMITKKNRTIWIAAKGIFKGETALGILQDVTAWKETQNELARRSTELELANRQISNLTDTIPDGFIYEYWQSKDGSEYKLNYVSQGCERLFEVSADEALKNADSLFSKIHPDDLVPFFKLVETKRKMPGKFDVDYRIVMEDKRIKWVNGRAYVRVLPDQSTIIEGIALDVTLQKNLEHDQREAKARLVESENNLRAILNASTDFTVFLDTQCIVHLANAQAYTSIKRLLNHELRIGDTFYKLLPINLQGAFLEDFKRALDGEALNTDREVDLVNKKTSWLQLRYLPVRNDQGKLIGVSFNATNITARKQAEIALQQSEERFKMLYNYTPAMLHSIDRSGKLVRVSDYWLQKMGYERHEVIGRYSTEFLSAKSRRKALDIVLPKFFETGELKNIEYNFITKDGQVLSTLLSASSERDENDEVITSLAVITDITEKKKLEKEMQKLAMIAARTSNAVIFTDAEGQITWVNEGFERITEFTRAEVIGKKPGYLLQGSETNGATIEFMRKKIQQGEGFKVEVLNYTKSKKEYWLDIEVMPIHDDANNITGFMAIESDITPLKLAITEMLNSQVRLQTMMNNAPMIVFMKDLQGRYTYYNQAYEKSRGHERVQAGHTDCDLFDEQTALFLKGKDKQAIVQTAPVSYEHQLNGRAYYTVVFPILNQKQKMYALGGISVDLTERKQAEAALQQSEANLKSIFENSDTGFVLIDSHNNIVSFNGIAKQAIYRMTDRNIAVGDGVLSFISDKRREAIRQFINDALNGKASSYEIPFTLSNGDQIWIHGRFFPVMNNENTSGVIYAMSDITERKHAETEIRRSREQLKLISDNLPSVAIYQYEVQTGRFEGHYNYFSAGVKHITGLTAEELVKDPNLFEVQIHPEDYAQKQEILKAMGDQPKEFNQEYRFRHRSGHWCWLRTRSKPTQQSNGSVIWNGLILDITDIKMAELSRLESEKRFRSMADAAPVLIWMSGLDKKCDYFNKGWLDFTGRKLEQELGDGWAEGVHPDDFERCLKIYSNSFDERRDFVMQYRLRRHDGEHRWIVDHGVPRYLPDGEFIGYIGSCLDIHDMIEIQNALQESEERLRKLSENIPAGALYQATVIDNKRVFTFFSAGIESIIGYSSEEIVADSSILYNSFHPDDIYLLQPNNKQIFNTLDIFDQELRVIHRNGQVKWVHMRSKVRKVSQHILRDGFMIDITERKKAEAALKKSEDRLRSIIENEPNCIKLLNSNGELLDMNPAGLAMIEAENLKQVEGHCVSEIVDEPFRQLFSNLTQSAIQGNGGQLQFSITGLKGTKRWLETHAVPMFDQETNQPIVLGITRDITEQKSRSGLLETISGLQESFIVESDPKAFFDFALDEILKLTESEYGFIGEVLAEDGMPYLKTISVSNIAWNEESKTMFAQMPEGLVFRNLDNLLGAVIISGKLVISNNPLRDPRSGGLPPGHPDLNCYAGIPIYKGDDHVGILGLANRKGGFTEELIGQWDPLLRTLSNILESYRVQKVRRSVELELVRTSDRLDLAHKASGLGVWQIDFVNNKFHGDQRIREIFGIADDEITHEDYLQLIHPEDREHKRIADREQMATRSNDYKSEYRIIRPSDGQVRFIKSQGIFFRDEAGKPVQGVSVAYDQTKEKNYELSLLSSLREKETLIKEIHHRVKNNLQLISSILYIRMVRMKHSDIKTFLEETRQKIRSIAIIHERLLQTESVNKVDIADYLNKLILDLQMTILSPERNINMQIEIESINMNLDMAINCGLIVNELITNAVKHAFTNRSGGTIGITLKDSGNGYLLIVKDDGCGLPDEIVLGNGSFGMQLLDVFIRQLKAQATIIRNEGTRYEIQFGFVNYK